MKERPILFSAPMVRAILEGRKSQTRRVVGHLASFGKVREFRRSDTPGYDWAFRDRRGLWNEVDDTRLRQQFCPYGVPDNRLWVRETFAIEHACDGSEPPFADGRPVWRRPASADVDSALPAWRQAHYRATDPTPDLCCESVECAQCRDHDYGPHWQPSIHMPRWASRILLKVTDVRVERLQDISEADAQAEGVQAKPWGPWWQGYKDVGDGELVHQVLPGESPPEWMIEPKRMKDRPWLDRTACAEYRYLWESINGAGSWDLNPWVWAISFKRIGGEA